MVSLIIRFNTYRFDYAALIFDAIRAFASEEYRAQARMTAVALLVFMVLPPAVTLWRGLQPFGDPYVFGIVLLAWSWILERPAWALRQWRADPTRGLEGRPSPKFDLFFHIFVCAVAFGCILAVVLFGSWIEGLGASHSEELMALVWGVALAGATDIARSLVALFLARLHGFPLYGAATRKETL